MGWLLLLPLLIYTGCTNVNQMYQRANARRRQTAASIGLWKLSHGLITPMPRAKLRRFSERLAIHVPCPYCATRCTTTSRTTLKQDIVHALATIGDTGVVVDIGRLLDRSLNTADSDIRMAAVTALGQLGCDKSAEILINALRYYDLLMVRDEQRSFRGVFTGEEQTVPSIRE